MSKADRTYIEYEQEQGMLFPPRVGELVGEDHPARMVSEIVDRMYRTWRQAKGRHAREMMVLGVGGR